MTLPDAAVYGQHAVPYRVQDPRVTYGTEPKVRASTGAGASAAALITPTVVRIVDDLWFGGGPISVPVEYIGVIGGAVVLVCSWAAGWLAPHVDRLQHVSQ